MTFCEVNARESQACTGRAATCPRLHCCFVSNCDSFPAGDRHCVAVGLDDARRTNRRSVRLSAFDYRSPGAYFVTIVTNNRDCALGAVVGENVELSALSEIVDQEWRRTAQVRLSVTLGSYVVMPNHLHGILWLSQATEEPPIHATNAFQKPVSGSLSTIVGLFKSQVTKRASRELGPTRVWQRGFHERVIRSDLELRRIDEYVLANPRLWAEDKENPRNVPVMHERR